MNKFLAGVLKIKKQLLKMNPEHNVPDDEEGAALFPRPEPVAPVAIVPAMAAVPPMAVVPPFLPFNPEHPVNAVLRPNRVPQMNGVAPGAPVVAPVIAPGAAVAAGAAVEPANQDPNGVHRPRFRDHVHNMLGELRLGRLPAGNINPFQFYNGYAHLDNDNGSESDHEMLENNDVFDLVELREDLGDQVLAMLNVDGDQQGDEPEEPPQMNGQMRDD